MIKIFIPARKNSTGIPFKNRRLLSKTVGIIPYELRKHTYISSDDDYIIEKAKDYGINGIVRAQDISQNNTPTKTVVEDFVDRAVLKSDDIIIMLYLTSPSRTWNDVENALKFFYDNDAKSLLCRNECNQTQHPYLMLYPADNQRGRLVVPHKLYRRQDYPECFQLSHCISMFQVGELISLNQNLYNDDTVYFPMRPDIDINTQEELEAYLTLGGDPE